MFPEKKCRAPIPWNVNKHWVESQFNMSRPLILIMFMNVIDATREAIGIVFI